MTSIEKSCGFGAAMEEYELTGVVGKGSFATVWLAKFLPVQTQEVRVCIKIIELKKNSDIKQLFTEISLMKRLTHPNIVSLHTAFCPTGSTDLWLVMPYMKGGSLQNLLKTNPEFKDFGLREDQPLLATILQGVLKGVSYLHKEGITHRDLKGSNCFIHRSGDVKIGDFGESEFLIKGGFNRYRLKSLRGTPWFMAPEVVEDESEGYDYSIDIWSFGMLALQLTFGKPPWAKENAIKVMNNILNKNPINEYDWRCRDDISSLEEMCKCCLIRDFKQRATASRLLKHSFFELASTREYVRKRVLVNITQVLARKRSPPSYYTLSETKRHSFNFKGMTRIMANELELPSTEVFEDYSCTLEEKEEMKKSLSESSLRTTNC